VTGDPVVVLLVPVTPAPTGNGLAMRAGMLLDALAPVAQVHVTVVPVAGRAETSRWLDDRAASVTVMAPVTRDSSEEHVTRQLADAGLRERLQRTAPLPRRARLAPPTLAPDLASRLTAIARPHTVLIMRLYLAPLGLRLARALGADRAVVDADDDDVALLRSLGDDEDADAFDRLARAWLPDADAVLAASRGDAAAITARAGIPCDVVPNAAPQPSRVVPRPRADRLLFVGNLTYEPNRVAARALAREILPAVRRRRPGVTLDIVGSHDGSVDELGAAGVRVTGAVLDVTPCYEAADLVVVPLSHGAGTRIKVLEALGHGRPVVATPIAVAGLELDAGSGGAAAPLTIGDGVDDLADAIVERLAVPGGADVERAAARLADRFSPAVVAPLVRSATLGSSPASPPRHAGAATR